jgi:phage-related protein
MPGIGLRVHELRLRDRSGGFRVVYVIVRAGEVHLVHAFQKKTRATPQRSIEIARQRIRELRR